MERKKPKELLSQFVATWSKLGLALSSGCRVNDTHHEEMRRFRIGDKCVAKNPRDSRRENKLIMGRHILIDIYMGKFEMRGKVNSKSLK